jgi:hypothetical protein
MDEYARRMAEFLKADDALATQSEFFQRQSSSRRTAQDWKAVEDER